MYFPWVGLFEQIKLCDRLVIYDDVEYSKGSYTNRVQLKGNIGQVWMTLPLEEYKNGKKINEYNVKGGDWRLLHLNQFKSLYRNSPFVNDAIEIMEKCYEINTNRLSEVTLNSMRLVMEYIGLKKDIYISSNLNIDGKSTERVFDIVKYFSGSNYITGHGAINYLDHELFERENISVSYINYEKKEYSQLYSGFIPYVSILDLIANMGKESENYLISKTIDWKNFKIVKK